MIRRTCTVLVGLGAIGLLAVAPGAQAAFSGRVQGTQLISTGRLHLSVTEVDGSSQHGPWRSVQLDDVLDKHTWPKQTVVLQHELVVSDDGTVPARSLWLAVSPGELDKQVANRRFDLGVTVAVPGAGSASLPARSLEEWEADRGPSRLPLPGGMLSPGHHVTLTLTVTGAAAPGLLNPELSPTYTLTGSDGE